MKEESNPSSKTIKSSNREILILQDLQELQKKINKSNYIEEVKIEKKIQQSYSYAGLKTIQGIVEKQDRNLQEKKYTNVQKIISNICKKVQQQRSKLAKFKIKSFNKYQFPPRKTTMAILFFGFIFQLIVCMSVSVGGLAYIQYSHTVVDNVNINETISIPNEPLQQNNKTQISCLIDDNLTKINLKIKQVIKHRIMFYGLIAISVVILINFIIELIPAINQSIKIYQDYDQISAWMQNNEGKSSNSGATQNNSSINFVQVQQVNQNVDN